MTTMPLTVITYSAIPSGLISSISSWPQRDWALPQQIKRIKFGQFPNLFVKPKLLVCQIGWSNQLLFWDLVLIRLCLECYIPNDKQNGFVRQIFIQHGQPPVV